jgi:hypothetical protein
LWCGNPTKGDRIREHIFPKAIGGQKTLKAGSVCKKCNHEFGQKKYGFDKKYSLDEALKKEHPAMMHAYQVDPRIGRIRCKEDRIRKLKEKAEINGVGEATHTRISRKDPDEYWVNSNFTVTSDIFVRSLHKCTANVLCDNYGSKTTRENYKELLKFVKDGGDVRPWSYAVSYSDLFKRPLTDEPKPLVLFPASGENKNLVSFIHTSGIWITGSQPFLLNPMAIEAASEIIARKLVHDNEPNPEKSLTDCFGFNCVSEGRAIGKLKFLWIVKEMDGKPNDEFLYLLTKCRVCGQTNPTGITLPREIICNGNVSNTIHYNKNTWNRYTLQDLIKLGLKVEKWDRNRLECYMTQGISIPLENDVKKLEINDCKTTCINCGEVITFSASDCFV